MTTPNSIPFDSRYFITLAGRDFIASVDSRSFNVALETRNFSIATQQRDWSITMPSRNFYTGNPGWTYMGGSMHRLPIGHLSATLDNYVMSGTGSVYIDAVVNASLDDVELVADGHAAYAPINAVLNTHLDNATLVSHGLVGFTGIIAKLSAVLGNVVVTSTGTVTYNTINGNLHDQLDGAVVTSTGTVGYNGVTGFANITVANIVISSTASVQVRGLVNASLGNVGITSVGRTVINVKSASVLGTVIVHASGKVSDHGIEAGQLNPATLAATGTVAWNARSATLNAVLGGVTAVATGTVAYASISGASAVITDSVTASAAGTVTTPVSAPSFVQSATWLHPLGWSGEVNTVTLPVAPTAGNLLLFVSAYGHNNTLYNIPSTWTSALLNNYDTNAQLHVWWKISDGSEQSTVFKDYNDGGRQAVIEIAGANASTPFNTTAQSTNPTDSYTNPTGPITTTVNGCLIISIIPWYTHSFTGFTVDGGFTPINSTAFTGSGETPLMAYGPAATAGSVSTTFTVSDSSAVAAEWGMLAIQG